MGIFYFSIPAWNDSRKEMVLSITSLVNGLIWFVTSILLLVFACSKRYDKCRDERQQSENQTTTTTTTTANDGINNTTDGENGGG